MGRNGGHQRGDSMAAYGELFMATVTRSCSIGRGMDAAQAASQCCPSRVVDRRSNATFARFGRHSPISFRHDQLVPPDSRAPGPLAWSRVSTLAKTGAAVSTTTSTYRYSCKDERKDGHVDGRVVAFTRRREARHQDASLALSTYANQDSQIFLRTDARKTAVRLDVKT